jgi:PPK2 family polyphosphate:nucleotide phosphotransferase
VTARTGSVDLRSRLRVAPGSTVTLADRDPEETFGYRKREGLAKASEDIERLTSLQDRIWAEKRHRILVVLQGIDASGKDGTIRHVFRAFNPQGCWVVNFVEPTAAELAHDFLWRIHAATPGNGEIAIFNRSHYESVVVERVQKLVPEAVWERRFDHINAFERLLVDEGATIVKFFLSIDREEQLKRFRERYDDPTKRWKFQQGDLEVRRRWDDYLVAFDDALTRCSTEAAPWYVIPANKNWFRDLAVGEILAETLEDLKPEYPRRDDLPPDLTID